MQTSKARTFINNISGSDDENVNFPPIAENQEVTTIQNSTIEITLVATDEDNDPLTYIIVEQPTNGTITISDNIVILAKKK